MLWEEMFFGILYSFSRAPWGNLHNPQHSYQPIWKLSLESRVTSLSVRISLPHENTQHCLHSNIKYNSSDTIQKWEKMEKNLTTALLKQHETMCEHADERLR